MNSGTVPTSVFFVARFFSFYVISVSFTSLASLSPFFFYFFASILLFFEPVSFVNLSSKQCRSMYSPEPRPSLFFRFISFYFTAYPLCNRTLSFTFYEVNIFLVKHSTPRCFFCVSLFRARFVFSVIMSLSLIFVYHFSDFFFDNSTICQCRSIVFLHFS